jgi:hypothetical protein
MAVAAESEAGWWRRSHITTGTPTATPHDQLITESWRHICDALNMVNSRPDMHSVGLPARSVHIQTAKLTMAYARIVDSLGAPERQAHARDPVRLSNMCSMAADNLTGAVNLLLRLADELYGVPRCGLD